MKRYDEVGDYYQDFREVEEGDYCKYDDHLAAMKELTDRLAQVEKERDVLKDRESQMGRQLAMASIELEDAHKERDELKRGKSCDGCMYEKAHSSELPCKYCVRRTNDDYFKPRDPSAEKGGGK